MEPNNNSSITDENKKYTNGNDYRIGQIVGQGAGLTSKYSTGVVYINGSYNYVCTPIIQLTLCGKTAQKEYQDDLKKIIEQMSNLCEQKK